MLVWQSTLLVKPSSHPCLCWCEKREDACLFHTLFPRAALMQRLRQSLSRGRVSRAYEMAGNWIAMPAGAMAAQVFTCSTSMIDHELLLLYTCPESCTPNGSHSLANCYFDLSVLRECHVAQFSCGSFFTF